MFRARLRLRGENREECAAVARSIPASNRPKKRDGRNFAQKWGPLAMGEPARSGGIPSSGRGRKRVMPPETAGQIADDGGRFGPLDVRS